MVIRLTIAGLLARFVLLAEGELPVELELSVLPAEIALGPAQAVSSTAASPIVHRLAIVITALSRI